MYAASASTAESATVSSASPAADVSVWVSFQHSRRCRSRRDANDGVRAGFRNDISYGSIAPPVTYVLFVVFIVLMKAATVYAMRGLKQAK